MSKKNTRKSKTNVKRNLQHVIESEAKRLAQSGESTKKKTHSEEIIPNDIIAEKSEKYIRLQQEKMSFITKDATRSIIMGLIFVALIGGLYAYDQSSMIIEAFSAQLLSFIL